MNAGLWRPALGVVLACAGVVAILDLTDGSVFEPYFGSLNPTLVTGVALALGALCLRSLRRRGWFSVWRGETSGFAVIAATAAVLAVPVIVVDVLGGFGPDINVAWPRSLLFYPVIALVAECVFHVIPLGAISASLARTGEAIRERARWGAMGAVCLIEPALQMVWGTAQSPVWANAYVGMHVLVFNVLSVNFFRRYDFVSMYVFRLIYYLLWHVAWGGLRLDILFGG